MPVVGVHDMTVSEGLLLLLVFGVGVGVASANGVAVASGVKIGVANGVATNVPKLAGVGASLAPRDVKYWFSPLVKAAAAMMNTPTNTPTASAYSMSA